MSKKFKSQASSSRAAAGAFGTFGGFSGAFSTQGREPSSLTYVAEPPDLSRISEPQLAIAFKNFLKKDEVTRTRALDELKDFVSGVESSRGTLDDGFLEAWVKIYPRASIDLSRRVRQTAYTIQGSVSSLVGKRIARFLPKVVGAWLAGLYDNDKPVHRSALESFTRVFSTDEKRKGVWKVYQTSILDFVDDVILQQTPQTLSDERTVKPDDAEAKSIYTLVRSAVAKEPEELDWKLVSAALIGKSLHASQLGSSSDLSESLFQATSARPQLWTDDYSGKSSATKRLLQYMQKGSQGGAGSFWPNLHQLLLIIPVQTLANGDSQIGLTTAIALTEAFQEGLTSRDEPRQNHAVAWKAYVDTGMWLVEQLSAGEKTKFLQERFSPLLAQYVKPEPDRSKWSLPALPAKNITIDYLEGLLAHGHASEVERVWTELSDGLLEAVKLSSPEQSKDFKLSQDEVCSQAERLLVLEALVLSRVAGTDGETQMFGIFERTNSPLLENCIQVLQTRNGKPYGAAAVVEGMVNNVAQIAQRSQALVEFVKNDAPELLSSPSADRLISIILTCRSWGGFGESFGRIIEQVAKSEPESSNAHAVQKLLSTLNFKEVDGKSVLGSLIMRALDQACKGSSLHWSIVIAVLQNQSSHGELTDSMFLSLIDALSDENKALDTLHGLSQIANSVPTALRGFQSGSHGSKLTGKLHFLAESPSEEVADVSESLIKTLKKTVVGETSARSSVEILQHNFEFVNAESLSIESLLSIAEELLHSTKPEDVGSVAKDILPGRQTWENALGPFLELPPRPSTAITSPLGGTVHLVNRQLAVDFKERYEAVPRDSSHCSSAFRLAYFITKVFSLFDLAGHLGTDELETLFHNLPLAVQLVDDDLSIENSNGITGLTLPEQREEYMEVVNDGRKVISGWVHSKDTLATTITSFWERKLEGLQGTSPSDYRVGESFVKIMGSVDSSNKSKTPEELTELCKSVRTANAVRTASWVALLRQSILSTPAGTRLCNELVADSTGLKPEDEKKDGLRKLSLLNLLLADDKSVAASIPTQRLMFLLKHLIQCLQSESTPLSVKAEILQSLTYVLPCIHEMYGSHWEESMDVLSTIWQDISGGDEALPLLLASFRLLASLKSIVDDEESNDDAKDAWAGRKTVLFNRLTSTLHKFDSSTTFYQPRDVAVDCLRRLLNVIPTDSLEDVSKVFPLLTAHSGTVQRAAYNILHRYIPNVQEQISFDVALSKTTVRLPDELMSLLLEAPTMASVNIAYDDDRTWADIRSYLLSWKVVFDHFVNASLTVQENYVTSIKENDTLAPLLEFMFDFLQGSHGKMIDASKFDIRSFELDQSETYERETQWLLVHLYFLCLRHVANMTKNWWIDTKKRIKGPVEAWTEKHVSPLVIIDALQGITDWMSTQDPNEERALAVKISPKTAEIIASIPVDEESPPVSLSISLPPAYPLQPAVVVGRSRVLVDEKKWKNWLLTIQGVIMFANGSLVDGLLAFRKNVQGALKGQSECAICYSVISTDMQTPNKRCATCKNTFHSIPNLNTLRRGGGRGRSRGQGGLGGGPPSRGSKDRVVQGTDHDASVSRLSAVGLGYLDDPFARALTPPDLETRRLPIINRGTYVRTAAIDQLVHRFLAQPSSPHRKSKKQIISLGAGSDTRAFRLLPSHPALIYHEIDFAVNTAAKIRSIRAAPQLQRALGIIGRSAPENTKVEISEGGDALHTETYHLHALDLRWLKPQAKSEQTTTTTTTTNLLGKEDRGDNGIDDPRTLLRDVDPTIPTLLISECCLIYLTPREAADVVDFFTQTLFPAATGSQDGAAPLGLILYEPIRPHDAFGRTMVSNLATRGIQLQTLHQYATLESQRQRLRDQGFAHGQAAADVHFIWERWVDEMEKERVAGLEMLDEMEEWNLLAQHYCVAWGWREGLAGGGGFEGWKDFDSQQEGLGRAGS
ncbi:hypothetical protein N8T08_002995 [Aspergillus melleus]|uniref:Uncharacterized protein n=1 Tax=Aspergillus melleus TaxID=138277 RepID=A0ACC3B7X1_9EURO|nr:hypothetical protein N8T08_002995 [Aspergillus melleus]